METTTHPAVSTRWPAGPLALACTAKRIWAILFAGNLFVFAVAYVFFNLRDANTLQFAGTIILGAAALIAVLLLYTGPTAYYGESIRSDTTVPGAFRRALPRILAVFAVGLFAWWMLGLISPLDENSWGAAGWLRTRLPLFLRRHVSEVQIHKWYMWKFAALRNFLIPGVLLPFAALLAQRGFGGFRNGWRTWGRTLKNWRYWLTWLVLFCVGLWAPYELLNWSPALSSLGREVASLIVRFLAAYLLFVTGAWLLSASLPWLQREES